jgi:hypothetical protein
MTAAMTLPAVPAACGNVYDFPQPLKHLLSATTFALTKPLNAQTVKKTQQN